MSFNGTQPCATAVLGGTITQQTRQPEMPSSDLSVDRGQIGYSLRATGCGERTVSANSNLFTVNGFCATGHSAVARSNPTATLLPNGTVLVAGGKVDQGPAATAQAELYNPTNGTFTATVATMTTQRMGHTATLLNDGTVLIVGGQKHRRCVFYRPQPRSIIRERDICEYIRQSCHFKGWPYSYSAGRRNCFDRGGFNGIALASAELYDPSPRRSYRWTDEHCAIHSHRNAAG